MIDLTTETIEITLRDYQSKAVSEVWSHLDAGAGPVMLCAPTGAGKTVMGSHIIREAENRGMRVYFLCDRVALVNQTSTMLKKYGIHHGIIQSSNTKRGWMPVQVCSIQTMIQRKNLPPPDMMILDEAHTTYDSVKAYIDKHNIRHVLGMTATPLTPGLGKIYKQLVTARTTNSLIAEGILSPIKVYSSLSNEMDLAGARVKWDGEWNAHDVHESGLKIIGDIPTEWIAHCKKEFGDRVPKTLVFSYNIDHGARLRAKFLELGYRFEQVSAYDGNDSHRAKLIQDFRDGKLDGLISCEALAKGFDVPDVECLILARPYRKSLTYHIQMLGRGMRANPGKSKCLVLDFCGNYLRFIEETVEFWELGPAALDEGDRKKKEGKEKGDRPELQCMGCGLILSPGDILCPSCGAEHSPKNRVQIIDGRMVKVDQIDGSIIDGKTARWQQSKQELWQQLCILSRKARPYDFDPPHQKRRQWAAGMYKSVSGKWPSNAWMFISESDVQVERSLKMRVEKAKRDYARKKASEGQPYVQPSIAHTQHDILPPVDAYEGEFR